MQARNSHNMPQARRGKIVLDFPVERIFIARQHGKRDISVLFAHIFNKQFAQPRRKFFQRARRAENNRQRVAANRYVISYISAIRIAVNPKTRNQLDVPHTCLETQFIARRDVFRRIVFGRQHRNAHFSDYGLAVQIQILDNKLVIARRKIDRAHPAEHRTVPVIRLAFSPIVCGIRANGKSAYSEHKRQRRRDGIAQFRSFGYIFVYDHYCDKHYRRGICACKYRPDDIV